MYSRHDERVRRTVPLSGFIGMVETFSNYRALLKKDPKTARRLSSITTHKYVHKHIHTHKHTHSETHTHTHPNVYIYMHLQHYGLKYLSSIATRLYEQFLHNCTLCLSQVDDSHEGDLSRDGGRC